MVKKTAGYLSSTLKVLSWHGEGGHKHGKAAKQEDSAHQTTKPSQKYGPVNRVTKKEERSEENKPKYPPRVQKLMLPKQPLGKKLVCPIGIRSQRVGNDGAHTYTG